MKRYVVDGGAAACRLVLQTVAADVDHYEADVPVADPDGPADVAADDWSPHS